MGRGGAAVMAGEEEGSIRVAQPRSIATDERVSNSLMAAIKRSQANQRRNPDTFHFYQQAATAQAPAAVKVDLSHLVIAILDDPVASRVFADAGFRSGDIKLAILRSAPSMPLLGRLPARCPSSSAAARNLAGAGEENCRRMAEILPHGGNPMLVSIGTPAKETGKNKI